MKFFLGWSILCAVLILLSLAFKSVSDDQHKGAMITGGLLVCSVGIIVHICRNKG